MGMVARECNRTILEDALRYVDKLCSPVIEQLSSCGVRAYLDLSDAWTFDHDAVGF